MRRAACVAITVILAIMACCQPAAASEDLGLGLASAATQLGGAGAAAVAFLVGMASDPALGEDLLNATVITGALVGVGKVLLGRARPFVPGADGGFTGFSLDDAYHSMPSGHTANAFAMATVLARHRPRWAPAAYLAAVAVGLSRIALGSALAVGCDGRRYARDPHRLGCGRRQVVSFRDRRDRAKDLGDSPEAADLDGSRRLDASW